MARHAKTKTISWIVGFFFGSFLVLKFPSNCNVKLKTARKVKDHITSTRSFQDVNITKKAKATLLEISSNGTVLESNEWLTCAEIKSIFQKLTDRKQYRVENADGNRAVYFTEIKNQTGQLARVVIKQATLRNLTSESDLYRYRSALREVENLRKLQTLKWKGIPQLYGSCVHPRKIIYIVSEIIGKPLCSGTGTDVRCAFLNDIKSFFKESLDPAYLTILWMSKVSCFFKQFEEHRVVMEDFSGINFYYSPQTLDIFVVDLDSFLFYGDVRINSRSSCAEHADCPRPGGNLWRFLALNHKIYYPCLETQGYCVNSTCRGYDASLHACGVARWLITSLRTLLPMPIRQSYSDIAFCLQSDKPENRCSLVDACDKATLLLDRYQAERMQENAHL